MIRLPENIYAEYPALANIWDNPDISEFQRRRQLRPLLRKARADLVREAEELERRAAVCDRAVVALTELQVWEKLPPVLQKNAHTRLHRLLTDYENREVYFYQDEDADKDRILFKYAQSFVVQHSWAKAFEGAQDFGDGEIQFPYPVSVFEFRITDKNVIVLVASTPDGEPRMAAAAFVEACGMWIHFGTVAQTMPPFMLAWEEIRAICIALEAEVATHSVVRAPHKLNSSRLKEGKIPLSDYHIVSLAHRSRVLATGGESGNKKRLHFRRGHWRHFESHRTWIKWTLVGNPELGFIDKEYRL